MEKDLTWNEESYFLLQAELLRRQKVKLYWTTSITKTRLNVEDMTTEHIQKVLAIMEKKAKEAKDFLIEQMATGVFL